MTLPAPPRVLFVCTANVNRSAMAERWAQHFFGLELVMAQVASAGVAALDARRSQAAEVLYHPLSRAPEFAVQAMAELGVPGLETHRAARLRAEDLAWADTVVVMEPRHAETAQKLAPEHADRIRGFWTWLDPPAETMWDPHGADLETYRRAARVIRGATERFVLDYLAERRARLRAARGDS